MLGFADHFGGGASDSSEEESDQQSEENQNQQQTNVEEEKKNFGYFRDSDGEESEERHFKKGEDKKWEALEKILD